MKTHLKPTDVPAFAEEKLPSAEQEHWNQHLPACPACSNHLYTYQLWMKKAAKEDVPELEPDPEVPDRILAGKRQSVSKPGVLRLLIRDGVLAAAAVLAGIVIGNWMVEKMPSTPGTQRSVSSSLTDEGTDLNSYLESLKGGTE